MKELRESILRRAEAFYVCATECEDQARKFGETAKVLREMGDKYSEQASAIPDSPATTSDGDKHG